MLFKNVAGQKVPVFAYNKTTGVAVTGDAANITAHISKDGAAGVASTDVNPTQIGGGWYVFDLTQEESDCDLFLLYAVSGTSNVLVTGLSGYTTGGAIPQAGVAAAATALSTANWTNGRAAHLDSINNINNTATAISDELMDGVHPKLDIITAKTNLIPAAPAAVGDIPSSSAIATAVWGAGGRTLSSFGTLVADIWAAVVDSTGVTTLLSRLTSGRATKLDNLDVASSTLMTSASYSAPDNAGIAAVKAQTDLLRFTGNDVRSTLDGESVTASSVTDKTGYSLTAGERTSISEALLKLDFSTVTGEASRSLLNAVRFLRNRWFISGATLTVTKEDDSTTAFTASVTTSASANPITGTDPS